MARPKRPADRPRPRVAIGPEMPGWGSWEWLGADLSRELARWFAVSIFRAGDEPDADLVLLVKHPAPADWAERVVQRAALVYFPVDHYGGPEEIVADAPLLRRCARIGIHCDRLRSHFEPYAPLLYLDHHVKFAAPLRRRFLASGNLLWVGVRSNLPPLVEWVNARPLPLPLDVLTNLERPQDADPAVFGFRADRAVTVHDWTEDQHREMVSAARAAIDIKGSDFRSRHKPASKAIDFLASGVPLAMNPDSSPVEHLAGLGFRVASPLDDRWLSQEYWQETRQFGSRLRRRLTPGHVAEEVRRLITAVLAERSAPPPASAAPRPPASANGPAPKGTRRPKAGSRTRQEAVPATAAASPRVYGLLLTKDDPEAFLDWCRDQLPLYDAIVCLDGSVTDATARAAARFPDRLVYLHERDFPIPHKTDHGLRRVAHREIVRRFGHGHWVMCCHPDEFCYHDPRKVAAQAAKGGYDLVSWFSPHFYPHPSDRPDWPRLRLLPLQDRFRHYHWDHLGSGLPWVEDRLYLAGPGVDWDEASHGSVRPHGLTRPAPFRPTFRHFKVAVADSAAYEREDHCAHYKHHWVGLADRTGLPFPVRSFEHLFVASIPKYDRCDRFDGTFDQPWNMGEAFRPDAPAASPAEPERLHRRAWDLALAGLRGPAREVLGHLAGDGAAPKVRALARSDLAALAAAGGDLGAARAGFREALALDPDCAAARENLGIIGTELAAPAAATPPAPRPVKVAVLSFLFDWPSTGGGNVHTAELCYFLGSHGFAVRHFHARFEPWDIGTVRESTPFPSEALAFTAADWTLPRIQERYRRAVDGFSPDYVILTDSWNMKPRLAEAVAGYPYLLRLQALECLCPLNNVRLLPEPGGTVRQCPLFQLATPQRCIECVRERGRHSGPLHQVERELSGFGTPEYTESLLKAFAGAEAVLVVNPLAEAMVSPYARAVRVVTAGMDPARFPWPPPAAPAADGVTRVLFAGLTGEWMKGFHVLHAACERLWRARRDFDLVATADPPERPAPFARYVGWQSQADLPKRLWECDVLAMPTVAQEALGRTAVEAMAAGRPVVASRIGGLPFTVADGATGLLCEPGDPDDLARKLSALLDDPALRERLGRAGRQRFEEQYAWPVIIERHYRPLLAPRR